MMSSQKKLMTTMLIAAVLMLVISAASFATESRVRGMGGFGNYLRDNSNVFTYPGTLYGYRGQAIAELRSQGDDASYTLGAIVPYNEAAFGLYLNRLPMRVWMPEIDIDGNDVLIGFDNATDFYFGKQMSSSDLGLRLSFGGSGHNEDNFGGGDDDLKASSRYIGLGGGLSSADWDFGVYFDLPAAKAELGDGEWTLSGAGFGVNARMFKAHGTDFEIIPAIAANVASAKGEYDSGVEGVDTEETKWSNMNIGVGIGFNYLVGGGSTVIFVFEPIGISSAKEEVPDSYKSTISVVTMPAFGAGFECQIKPWLTGRFGGFQTFQSVTEKIEYDAEGVDDDKETYWATNFDMTFGLSFYFGCFTIDGVFNEGLLFDGPYFISGDNNSTGPMHSSISITYDFKK